MEMTNMTLHNEYEKEAQRLQQQLEEFQREKIHTYFPSYRNSLLAADREWIEKITEKKKALLHVQDTLQKANVYTSELETELKRLQHLLPLSARTLPTPKKGTGVESSAPESCARCSERHQHDHYPRQQPARIVRGCLPHCSGAG